MKRVIFLLFILYFIPAWGQFEQYENKELSKKRQNTTDTVISNRFVKGGDIGLQLGTITLIKLSPSIGYYITDWALLGGSATYIYSSNKFYNTKGNIYGGSIFVQFYPFEFVTIHAEAEVLYIDMNYLTSSYWNYSYLLGPGFRQKLGQKASVTYLLLWDFNYSAQTPFSNPRLKILFLF